jgi:hypothetical protein
VEERNNVEPISKERWERYLQDRSQEILQKPSPKPSHYQELHIYYTDFDKLSEQDQEKFISFYYQTSVAKCLATFSSHFLNLIKQQITAIDAAQNTAISKQQKKAIFKNLQSDIRHFLSGLTTNLTRHSDSLSVKDSEVFTDVDIEPEVRSAQRTKLEHGFQDAMEHAVAAFNLHSAADDAAIDLKKIASGYRRVCCIKLQDIFAKVLTAGNLDDLNSQLTRLNLRQEKNIDTINNFEDGKTVSERIALSDRSEDSHEQGGQIIAFSSPVAAASSGTDTPFMSAGTAEKIGPKDLAKAARITLQIDHPLAVIKSGSNSKTKSTPLQLALSSSSRPIDKAYKLAWAIEHEAAIDGCTQEQYTEIESCFAVAKAYAILSDKVDGAFALVLEHVNQQLVKHKGSHDTLDRKLQHITTAINRLKRGNNPKKTLKQLRQDIRGEHSGKKTLTLVRDISTQNLDAAPSPNTQDERTTRNENTYNKRPSGAVRKLASQFADLDEDPSIKTQQNSIITDAHFINQTITNKPGNNKNLQARKLLAHELLGVLKQYLSDQKAACKTPTQEQQAQEKIDEVEKFEDQLIKDGAENLTDSLKQLTNNKALGNKRKPDLRCCCSFFTTSQKLALRSAEKYAANATRYKQLLVRT